MSTTRSRTPPILNIPNQLTSARLLMSIVLFILIEFQLWIACTVLFAVAAFTDWLDGYLARKLDLGSTLGRNFDPLVDKILIGGAYIFLLEIDHSGLTPWMVTLVVSRELLITGLRGYMESMGANFGADLLGKFKMVLQCAALLAIFTALHWPDNETLKWIQYILIYAMVAATALSGLQYLWKAFAVLKKPEQPREPAAQLMLQDQKSSDEG